MLLELPVLPWPAEHPIAERHYHIREPALCLLMLGVSYAADALWLIALPASSILFHPLLLLPLLCLVSLILSMDLVEPLRALLRSVVEFTPFYLAIEAATRHD